MSAVAADSEQTPLRLAATRRRIRLVWLLSGVVLIAGSGLGFGVVAQQLGQRRPVVVLSRPLPRGSPVAPADLAVAQVAADPGVALVPADRSGDLVGRTLLASLPAGALVTDDLLGPAELALDDDARTVGLELEPGGYPTPALAAGDRVSVVLTTAVGTVLTDDAVVLEFAPAIEGTSTMLASIVVDAAAAPRIAAAAAQDQARLLLHGAGR
ncbi:MAG TPA: SAF domain-containing protein [Euzebyales bacterium]|nr:SAF domain-containing protein [Euzebyales bacterium]